MQAHIPLESELADSLDELARQQRVSLEQMVETVVRQYLRESRREKIRIEAERYREMHSGLVPAYLNQHVAIHDGQLVDHDPDAEALVRRVRERFGRTPILITQVSAQPQREFVVHRPHLEASA